MTSVHVIPQSVDLLNKDNLKWSIYHQCNLTVIDGKVLCYKRVYSDISSEFNPEFKYKIGEIIEEPNAEISDESCAPGLHFSHPSYYPYLDGYTILACEVNLEDIITVQEGKFRAKKCKVLSVFD